MSEKKISFRDEIKYGKQKSKEERAMKDFNRNVWGLDLSAIVFLIVLVMTFSGIRVAGNLSMLLIVASLLGVFYFGRELRVVPKGQIHFSITKSLLCLIMIGAYILVHQGLWDWMDYGILGILLGVILLDVLRILKAIKELKS